MGDNQSCCGGGCSCSHDEAKAETTCPNCNNEPCTCSADNDHPTSCEKCQNSPCTCSMDTEPTTETSEE